MTFSSLLTLKLPRSHQAHAQCLGGGERLASAAVQLQSGNTNRFEANARFPRLELFGKLLNKNLSFLKYVSLKVQVKRCFQKHTVVVCLATALMI